ncbi:MAG: glycosyl transferase family 1, partial [Pseudomonadota bacterium]
MRLLFVHQNMPGQYRELVPWLARDGRHEIAFLTQRRAPPKVEQVRTIIYKPHHRAGAKAYGLSKVWESATGSGYGAARAAQALERDQGFKPDIVVGHVGWGELTFFKEVWPDVPIIGYFEYFYQQDGGLIGFEPDEHVSPDSPFLLAARNAVPLTNIEVVDQGQCPTRWQRDRFPVSFHERMYQCHDGIRCDRLHADLDASVRLSRLQHTVSREDEIVTYVARNLEKARGFHILMRALPEIQRARPDARILIVGGNDVSYGGPSEHPGSLRAEMEKELGAEVDWNRVHFLGQV